MHFWVWTSWPLRRIHRLVQHLAPKAASGDVRVAWREGGKGETRDGGRSALDMLGNTRLELAG